MGVLGVFLEADGSESGFNDSREAEGCSRATCVPGVRSRYPSPSAPPPHAKWGVYAPYVACYGMYRPVLEHLSLHDHVVRHVQPAQDPCAPMASHTSVPEESGRACEPAWFAPSGGDSRHLLIT
jgi:hypothetical protein